MNNIKREPGFYWVKAKTKTQWEVAEWYTFKSAGAWFLVGHEGVWLDADLEQINETRISEPE